jgi:ribosomal protein S27AE
MTEIIRHCPDCGRSRLFAQHHGVPGRCPDSADEYCPEWLCIACGATLLIGAIPSVTEQHPTAAAAAAARRDRVA